MSNSNKQRNNRKQANNKKLIKTGKANNVSSNENDAPKHSYNDVSWYAPSAQQLNDAGSLSFFKQAGVPIRIAEPYSITSDAANACSQMAPGLMSFRVCTCPGLSDSAVSPVNVAAGSIYSFVRHANSGSKNYDAPDLMMYLLAMDSIYFMYNHLKRAYGIMMTYSAMNVYYPETFVKAMGLDYNDFRSNLANFRAYLNDMALRINELKVPAIMPFHVRHSWLFSNVYLDANDAKSQAYMFVPHGYYTYEERISSEGTVLTYREFQKYKLNSTSTVESYYTFSDIVTLFDSMVQKVRESEDCYIISGDIAKAYSDSQMYKLSDVPTDYSVTPVYNPEVLLQIHNMHIVGAGNLTATYGADRVTGLDITIDVDTNQICWNPSLQNTYGGAAKRIINSFTSEMSPQLVMEATRLTPALTEESQTSATSINSTAKFATVGSDFVNEARVWFMPFGSSRKEPTYFKFTGRMYTTTGITAIMHQLATIEKFDWHPAVYLFNMSTDTTNPADVSYSISYMNFSFDLDNYTVVGSEELDKLHRCAILGLFAIGR